MAKLKFALILAATMSTMLAGAHPGPGGPGPRPLPMYGPRIQHALPLAPSHPYLKHHHHHHHHHSAGSFWTGVGVGLLGSLIAPTPQPPPLPQTVVVATPPNPTPIVIQSARVWVPPVYGERPIYRAGIYVGTERYIITPGYWR